MSSSHVTVLLQFPQMSDPVRVALSPRDIFVLDTCADRFFRPNGEVVYARRRQACCQAAASDLATNGGVGLLSRN